MSFLTNGFDIFFFFIFVILVQRFVFGFFLFCFFNFFLSTPFSGECTNNKN